MKTVWCWRCKADVVMLDEDEYARVIGARRTSERSLLDQLRPVLLEYERITGVRETDPNAVYHHRLAGYGPPCARCGKPLRTPRAKVCGACMEPVND
jgi:hypothetical protein